MMKYIYYSVISIIALLVIGCRNNTNVSAESNIDGPVLKDIPQGKYQLFSILDAVYEANPNFLDNQVLRQECDKMLLATLNYYAERNPALLTEFPVSFYTYSSHERKDGRFEVHFHYMLSDFPDMGLFNFVQYGIYAIMDRDSYSKMKNGKYIIKGKYKGPLEKSHLERWTYRSNPCFSGELYDGKIKHLTANLGQYLYEDITVELIEN